MARPLLQRRHFQEDVKNASILQWNARGLISRISDFRQFAYVNRFPVLVICEPNVKNILRLSGYEAFTSATCDKISKVLVYVRKELTYVAQAVPPHDDNQYVCLSIKKKSLSFTLVAGYISPSSRLDYTRLGNVLTSTSSPWIITGDFNAHHPLWGSTRTNSRGQTLVSFASDHDLCLLNDGSQHS